MPAGVPAGTDLRALSGWGTGRIYWSNWFSRELLEDAAFPIDDYIVEETVRVCLQLQADEPERPTDPVSADGSYQIEWEWRHQLGGEYAVVGQLVDANIIDRLISEVRRLRAKAAFEHEQVIPGLIDRVARNKWLKPATISAEPVNLVDHLSEQIARDISETETDLFLYGVAYRDKNGRRLDPHSVVLPTDCTAITRRP